MAYDRLSRLDLTERLLAQLIALQVNEPGKPPRFKPDDFLPNPLRPTPQEEKRVINETRAKLMESYMARKGKAN